MQNRREAVTAVGLLVAGGLVSPAFAQSGSSTASLAERFAATLSAHDIDGFAGLFSDSYVNHQVSAAAPSPPANVTPKQGTIAFFKARLTGLPDLKVAIEAMVTDKDHVAASFVYTGTHKGTYFGIAPIGSVVALHFVRYFPSARRADHRALGYGRYRRRPSATPRVIFQLRRCPLLAQSGHRLVRCTCPLSGVKRTCAVAKEKPWSPGRGSDQGLEEMGLGTVTPPLG